MEQNKNAAQCHLKRSTLCISLLSCYARSCRHRACCFGGKKHISSKKKKVAKQRNELGVLAACMNTHFRHMEEANGLSILVESEANHPPQMHPARYQTTCAVSSSAQVQFLRKRRRLKPPQAKPRYTPLPLSTCMDRTPQKAKYCGKATNGAMTKDAPGNLAVVMSLLFMPIL